jgi:hypothetical protein
MAALPGRSTAVSPPIPRPGALVLVRGPLAPPGGTLPAVVIGRLGKTALLVLATRHGRAYANLRDIEEVRP